MDKRITFEQKLNMANNEIVELEEFHTQSLKDWLISNDKYEDQISELKTQVSAFELNENRYEEEISKLKLKVISMRKECNNRYSNQLQIIRKLEAEKMLQIQDVLFKEQ